MLKKIDKLKSEFDDIPASLDGEVLMKVAEHGVITCTEKTVRFMKQATPTQRVRMGWDSLIGVDEYDTSHLPDLNLEKYREEFIDMLNVMDDIMGKGSRIVSIRDIVTSAQSIEELMQQRHSLDDILIEDSCEEEFHNNIKFKDYTEIVL